MGQSGVPADRTVEKIVVTDTANEVVEALDAAVSLEEIETAYCYTDAEALEQVADADVALISSLCDPFLGAAARLKWVHTRGGGVESLLSPTFRESPVALTCSKPTFGIPGAEFALSAMLMITRRNHLAVGASKTAFVTSGMDDVAKPEDLAGKTVGILGLGYMGRALAVRSAALGLQVVACTRRGDRNAEGVEREYDIIQMEAFLGRSDFLAVGLPMTEQTRGMIDGPFLAGMKSTAFIIDMSARTGLFDYPALVRAIETDQIGGIVTQPCGLDEENGMPPLDSDYWQRKNVLISTCRGTSNEQIQAGIRLFLDNLVRFRSGGDLLGLVDKQAGY